jgi:hypothetical protein
MEQINKDSTNEEYKNEYKKRISIKNNEIFNLKNIPENIELSDFILTTECDDFCYYISTPSGNNHLMKFIDKENKND